MCCLHQSVRGWLDLALRWALFSFRLMILAASLESEGWFGSTSFSTVFCSVLNSDPHFIGCFNLQVFK